MKDVRIDSTGQPRCWHCGSAGFTSKRTARAKVLTGFGALVTKKKLKCQACGEYNDTGNAKPYTGPESARLGKKFGTFTNIVGEAPPSSGAVPPPPPPLPPGWLPDASGRHESRYWDGRRWTEHVSDGGVQSIDPV